MPARYIGRDSASEDEREMIVLSRSKNAASITVIVEDGTDGPSYPRCGGVRAPGGPPGLQNRCGGESSQAGSIPVRLRVEKMRRDRGVSDSSPISPRSRRYLRPTG